MSEESGNQIMEYREYVVLKALASYEKEKHRITILGDDFKVKKYSQETMNVILSGLQRKGYINDTCREFTKVHAVQITDKGYDCLQHFWYNMIKTIFFNIVGRKSNKKD